MRIVTLFLLTTLTACGFEPVHGTKDAEHYAHKSPLAPIEVEVQNKDRMGQLFRIALEDALHPDNRYPTPEYTLTTTLEEIKQPIIIERDARITRYNLILRATYSLQHIESAEFIAKNKRSQRISSYNVSDSDFATFVADREARERGIETLARNMSMELITLLRAKP